MMKDCWAFMDLFVVLVACFSLLIVVRHLFYFESR